MEKKAESDIPNISSSNELPSDISTIPKAPDSETAAAAASNRRSKSLLNCVVCGDVAFGYNFDAISCESCKAFFRRNALRPPGKLKCRGHGHCEVNRETRKRCKKCRLEKCLMMGMRKEWILSEDEKRKKKRRAEENRRLRQSQESKSPPQKKQRTAETTANADNSSSSEESLPPLAIDDIIPSMTETDWSRIKQIRTAYTEAVAHNKVTGVAPYPATQPIHSTLDLIRIATYLSSSRLVTFIKKIPEFASFDSEDRVTLVKHNLLAVVFTHIVLIYDSASDSYHEHDTEDPIFQGKDWIEILGEEFYHDLTTTAKKLIEILEFDRTAVKLLLIIILFIKGFCAYDILHEPSLNNMIVVFDTQNLYLDLLYKYCLHQHGLNRTNHLFINLISQLFSIQRLAVHLKDIVHGNVDASQISPLMQSVLQLPDNSSSR